MVGKFIKGFKYVVAVALSSAQAFAQSQPPLQLTYQAPATIWEASLPLGNGRLGAMPDGGIFNEHVVLNDITLWSGAPQDADLADAYQYLPAIQKLLLAGKNTEAQDLMSKYFKCKGPGSGMGNGANVPYGSYQVLADLDIQYQYGNDSARIEPKQYNRQLSLDRAIASTRFNVDNTAYTREYFTSFDDDVIIIKLSASQAKQINCKLSLKRPERFETKTDGQELQMVGRMNNGTDGKGMQYIVRLKVKAFGGSVDYSGEQLQITDADSALVYIAAGTDYQNAAYRQTTADVLQKAMHKSYALQKLRHTKNFQRLFNRSSLYLGSDGNDGLATDERLAKFATDKKDRYLPVLYFGYGKYLAICSTRPGLLPPNLQGLWANTVETPWNGDYHLDINIQMNEWPLEVTNLGGLNEPYFKLVQNLVTPGQKTAKAYYNADGWIAHVITNIWGYTSPGEDYSWGANNTGSAWLCQMLWNHYEFTHDNSYLRKLYPVLKGSAAFYLSMMIREPTHGWLVTAPSNSPENSFIMEHGEVASVCYGPTIDNQLVRHLFNAVMTAGAALQTDTLFRQKLQAAVDQLPPNQIGTDGRLMEWLREYGETEIHHRHVAHLWGLYPGSEIGISKPALADAAKASLITRGDEGTGWSFAWKMNLWARLHDGNHAYALFVKLMRPVTTNIVNMSNGGGSYPNLFCAHPPFQIDGNFGGTAAIAEMLLQSQDGMIELLPALPDEWKDGSFTGFRARGGASVSASWTNGRINHAAIKATVDGLYKVKVPDNLAVKKLFVAGQSLPVQADQKIISLRLKKGSVAKFEYRAKTSE